MLYSKDEYLYNIVTDEEGIAKSNRNLPIGKYYLVEQNTPDDYFEGDIVPFSISTDGKIEVVDLEDGTRLMYIHEEVEVINYKKITTLEISKQDATTSDEVEGATLKLYDSSGNLIESWVSTKEKHVIKNLHPGEYTLVEEMAPNGYVVSNEITFTIEHTSKVKKVIMYDEEVTGKLHVIKVDGYNKKPLSGVSFMLFKKSDTVIGSGIDQYLTKKWESEMDKEIINAHKQNLSDLYVGSYVTDENGEFTTEKLMYGDYYVVETLVKDGYFLVKDPVGFSIETKDQIVELTIENEGKEGRIDVNSMPNTPGNGNGHYPKTGDRSPIMLITMIMLMAGGMLLLLKKKKKIIMSLAVAMMLGVSVSSIPAFAAEQKTYTETKTDTYDSDDESTYDFSFEKEIEIDGTKYELDHITYEKEEKTSIKEGVEVTVKKEYEGVEKDFTAPKTITYEGITYELLDEKVTESGDGSLYLYYYDETDYQSEKPDHKESVEYVYHDESSGTDYTVKLPYARTELLESNYAIPVTFSGTVTGYDAAYIVIGDYKIENPGENLLLDDAHISTILESIGVNPADYSDLKVYYTGEAYLNEEGMLCRDYEIRALMFGSKYRIYYEDNVKGLVKTYTCEANYGLGDKMLEEFTNVSYDVSAKATYYEVLEEEKGFFETLPGKAVLAGSIILGITVILALFIYLLKGGRKDTDYKTRADAKKDYKKLNQKNR